MHPYRSGKYRPGSRYQHFFDNFYRLDIDLQHSHRNRRRQLCRKIPGYFSAGIFYFCPISFFSSKLSSAARLLLSPYSLRLFRLHSVHATSISYTALPSITNLRPVFLISLSPDFTDFFYNNSVCSPFAKCVPSRFICIFLKDCT